MRIIVSIALGLFLLTQSFTAMAASCPEPKFLENVSKSGPHGTEVTRVYFPDAQFLRMMKIVVNETGDANLSGWPKLPGNGVEGKHLCAKVALVEKTDTGVSGGNGRNATLVNVSLLLANNVDYQAEYPVFYDEIVKSKQLIGVEGREYLVFVFPEKLPEVDDPVLSDIVTFARENFGHAEDAATIRFGRAMLVPVN